MGGVREKLLKRKSERIAEAEAAQQTALSQYPKSGGRRVATPMSNNTGLANAKLANFRHRVSQSMLKVTAVTKKTSTNYQRS